MDIQDGARYVCAQCGTQDVCEDAVDVFAACLCQSCYDRLWSEYVAAISLHSGVCVQCERNCDAISPAGLCQGCTIQAAIEYE